MLAVQWRRPGDPAEVAEVVDLPEPAAPSPGEVQLAPEYSPINPADLLRMQGGYGAVSILPAIAGGEGVARVIAVGDGVTELAAGDRVLVPVGRGCWREALNVPARGLFPLPAGSPLQFAMASINPPTAWQLLHSILPLREGDWIVQNAAASAVGRMVVQLARGMGVRTINIVRRPEQVEELRTLGANEVFVDGADLPQRVALRVQEPVRLGIDAIAGAATGALARIVAEGATVVTYGLLSNQACAVEPRDVVFRDVRLRGFWLARCFTGDTAPSMSTVFEEVIGMLKAGTLHSPVAGVYDLADIREALQHAVRPSRRGKVLVRINRSPDGADAGGRGP